MDEGVELAGTDDVQAHALRLLELWPDAEGVKVYERGDRDIYLSVWRNDLEAAR